jgi:phosphoribosylamine--glycine ligase
MASRGYPESYDKGKPISGLERAAGKDVKVFHAGTRLEGGRVVTDGGRVLCVVGAGETVRAACDAAYSGVRKISWDGAFYRRDIGHRAIAREESA